MGYIQSDPRWAGLALGDSEYKMGPYGCLTTAHAQALALAGWTSDDPGVTCTELSHNGGYTDGSYPGGSGLLLWGRVSEAFPQYRWKGYAGSGGRYEFVQVTISGRFLHWVLRVGDTYYDPLDGSEGPLKPAYRPTGDVKTADIEQAPPSRFPLTVTVKGPLGLRVRTEPNTSSTIIDPDTLQPGDDVIDPGASFTAVDEVEGESIGGKSKWLKTRNGFYVWNRDNY